MRTCIFTAPDGRAIVAEVASRYLERLVGLIGRRALEPGRGLWFPRENSLHMFFMAFAIDAICLGPADADGRREIVRICADLAPWRGLVLPVRGAEGFLEVAAGTAATFGLRVGDQLIESP